MEKDFYLLRYLISEENAYKESNAEALEVIRKTLYECGFTLDIRNGGEMSLMLHPDLYSARRGRNAGRREKTFFLPSSLQKEFGHVTCTYSDIVFMEQSMPDGRIIETLGIPASTFFRHKKKLYESGYYLNLDKNRLSDREYLDRQRGNSFF